MKRNLPTHIAASDGFSPLLMILTLAAVSALSLAFLQNRIQKGLAAQATEELRTDELAVKAELKAKVACESVPRSCGGQRTYEVQARDGNMLLTANPAGTRLGRWKARLQCSGDQLRFELALDPAPQSPHLADPAWRKAPWARGFPASSICPDLGPAMYKPMASKPQYAPECKTRRAKPLPCRGACRDAEDLNYYCRDNAVAFPRCDKGYRPYLKFIDRYGFSGRDLTKYVICERMI